MIYFLSKKINIVGHVYPVVIQNRQTQEKTYLLQFTFPFDIFNG